MLRLSQPATQEKYALDRPRFTIGRDPSNDLVLEDDLVSGFHATIFMDDGKVEIVDQGSNNGTFVNDRLVSGRVVLKAWDNIRLGNSELEVVDSSGRRPTIVQAAISSELIPAVSQQGKADGTLRLVSSGAYSPEIKIYGSLTIGRGAENDLCLANNMVSGSHARLEISGERAEIVDLGSTNGTWVNNKKVQRQQLQHGDRLRFDEVEYEILLATGVSDKTQVNPAIQDDTMATVVRPVIREESNTAVLVSSESSVKIVPASEFVKEVDSGTKAVLPKVEKVPQPPPYMPSPSMNTATSHHSATFGRSLSFEGNGLQALGYGLLASIASLFVVPAAWGLVPFWQWLVGNVRFSDNTEAKFRGRAGQIWWAVGLLLLFGFLPSLLSRGDQSFNFTLRVGLPFLLLPLTAFLWLVIIRWLFESIQLSCGTRLHFNGDYAPFLGWFALNMIAPVTIIGWAWIHVASFRWLCSKIEGGGQEVVFHGQGHEYLWRVLVASLASAFILPAPWMFVWLLRWLVEQIEVR